MDNSILEKIQKVDYIFSDSRYVLPNSAFIAFKGENFDGHDFIRSAYEKGARLFFISNKKKWPNNIKAPYICLPQEKLKKLYFELCHLIYRTKEIFKKIKIIGITGTNGKTTTAFSLQRILSFKYKVGLIGTEVYKLGNFEKKAFRTTPSLDYLLFLFKKAYEENLDYVVMEVSSHALQQKRVYKVPFYLSIFTNLSQDHLDYHKNMENYFKAKTKIFFQTLKYGLINPYDKYSLIIKNLSSIYPCKILSLPLKKKEKILDLGKEKLYLNTNLVGDYNLENVAFASYAAYLLGMDKDRIKREIQNIYVPGRLEKIRENIFIDYAHTPDGLERVCKALKSAFSDKNLIVIFGAGGNRDKKKRPLMLKSVLPYASKIILTMDNPRFEDDIEILLDILEGVKSLPKEEKKKIYDILKEKGFYKFSEKIILIRYREDAIKYALRKFNTHNNIFLFAGKGNENYIEIKGEKRPFSEKKEILKWV